MSSVPIPFGGRPYLFAVEIAVNDATHLGHARGIVLDEGVRDAVRKAQAAVGLVEPQ
jgi:hypothetical protein